MAVERLKSRDNIVALSAELGVNRRLLYKWRDQLEPIDDGEAPLGNGHHLGTLIAIPRNPQPCSQHCWAAVCAGRNWRR
jgi:hypothetical protein